MRHVENRLMYVDEIMNFSHLLANQSAALDFELPVGFQLFNKAVSTGTGWLKTASTLGINPRIKQDFHWVFAESTSVYLHERIVMKLLR